MQVKQIGLMLVSMCALMGAATVQADVYVVANGSIDLSDNEIVEVYLGKKLMVTSIKLVPVDNASIQNEFLDKVLKVEMSTYTEIWIKKGLSDGLNPPEIRPNDAAVIAYLRKTPGAIGYVSQQPAAATGLTTIRKY